MTDIVNCAQTSTMSFGDWMALVGVTAAIWTAAITLFRTETRALIDRTIHQVTLMEELMVTVWGSSSTPSLEAIDPSLAEKRLLHAGERIEALGKLAAAKTRSIKSVALRNAFATIVGKATVDIERRESIGTALRLQRCHNVRAACDTVIDTLERDFERAPRKIFFW